MVPHLPPRATEPNAPASLANLKIGIAVAAIIVGLLSLWINPAAAEGIATRVKPEKPPASSSWRASHPNVPPCRLLQRIKTG